MNRRPMVGRFEVPIDDQWHTVELSNNPHGFACRYGKAFEFWAVINDGPTVPRQFQVFGTGHPMPASGVVPVGTALAFDGQLVWHLMEKVAER